MASEASPVIPEPVCTDVESAVWRAQERQVLVFLSAFAELFGDGSLPKRSTLEGCVIAQYRTVKGKRYGPYYFRVWRDLDGRQRKEYVPREKLEAVRDACRENRRLKRLGSRRYVGRFLRRAVDDAKARDKELAKIGI